MKHRNTRRLVKRLEQLQRRRAPTRVTATHVVLGMAEASDLDDEGRKELLKWLAEAERPRATIEEEIDRIVAGWTQPADGSGGVGDK